MKTPLAVLSSDARRIAVIVISSAAFLSMTTASFAAKAGVEPHPSSQPPADQMAKLPVESAFQKITSGENKGLYRLTLKNTSTKALQVSVAIEESVVAHNRPKNRTVSATIEAGKSWSTDGLAAHDKLTVTAEGFAPLNIVVP